MTVSVSAPSQGPSAYLVGGEPQGDPGQRSANGQPEAVASD